MKEIPGVVDAEKETGGVVEPPAPSDGPVPPDSLLTSAEEGRKPTNDAASTADASAGKSRVKRARAVRAEKKKGAKRGDGENGAGDADACSSSGEGASALSSLRPAPSTSPRDDSSGASAEVDAPTPAPGGSELPLIEATLVDDEDRARSGREREPGWLAVARLFGQLIYFCVLLATVWPLAMVTALFWIFVTPFSDRAGLYFKTFTEKLVGMLGGQGTLMHVEAE